jgi:methionyl aminopeptidase
LTVIVGTITPKTQRILDVARDTLSLAISNVRPGRKWSEIARIIQWNIEKNNFSVVREFAGHGVGRLMHEEPKVPNYVSPEQLRNDFKLQIGVTIAIEPMVAMGKPDVEILEDQWTIITKDHQPAAHFEHTIVVTESGCEILTDNLG